MELSRRQVLVGLSAAALTSGAALRPAARADAGLPATRPWTPRRGEVEPGVKAQATALLEAVGSWSGSAGDMAQARRRAAPAGDSSALVDGLADLLGPGEAAVLQVRDAQYGGILSSSSSVLVVVDQWTRDQTGIVRAGGSTFDVRLVRSSPHWKVVEINPARPGPVTAQLSRVARSVLANSRLRLPFAATADVRAGNIHDSVLSLLTSMATAHVVDVSVLRSGHPLHVFGTARLSDHPRGRAVDIWALDGRPLVVPANHPLAVAGMKLGVAHGAYNVGGPVQLNGRQYFSDRTHQDHIHLGFSG